MGGKEGIYDRSRGSYEGYEGHEGGEGEKGIHHRSRGSYEGNEGHEGGESEEGIRDRSRCSHESNEGHESDEGVALFLHVPADGLLQATIVTLGRCTFFTLPCACNGALYRRSRECCDE